MLAYAALVAAVWRLEREPPEIGELAELDDDDDDGAGRGPALALLLVAVGLAVMTAGGAAAVEGATRVVTAWGRTDEAVGLVVLALATTAELFALVLAAARRGVEEVAVAAVVGSAAYNATATLGGAALVVPAAGRRRPARRARRRGAAARGGGAGPVRAPGTRCGCGPRRRVRGVRRPRAPLSPTGL